ncbi:protein germ cell-less [Bradysia coprophila]|uniref:protein germ cell-less n=1 Tax=Bradysia coprophila TaxID=38358 RepID=UPI00187DD978|nr:protein germ cell-less [Bradysia coprophila]
MGALLGKMNSPLACGSVTQIITGRKRKRENSESSDDVSNTLSRSMNTPKKKKLLTTTQYIYQALYKEQLNSDITVLALGKTWRLHKVYLCQSSYFASMFGGSWRETNQDFVNIEIVDPKITINAMETVFGSLYLDEVVIEPKDVTSVLATATLFQLDELINRCAEVMIETVNAETSINYYEAACEYGVHSVKKSAFQWLLLNLLSFLQKHPRWLQQVNTELMTALVSSPDLFVVQTEFTLYLLLRQWLILKLFPDYEQMGGERPDFLKYFSSVEDNIPFLQTARGRRYDQPFRKLRIQYLINHPLDLDVILNDRLIPRSWLYNPIIQQWHSMLKIDHSVDSGPQESDSNVFLETCLRCGRILQEQGFQKWRWTGFNFGLDLILITDARTLSIKRHQRPEYERLLSMQTKRQFLLRITIASLNDQRQAKHTQTTDIQCLSLEKNQETTLIFMDQELTYPLYISVNLLVVSPNKIKRESTPSVPTEVNLPTDNVNENHSEPKSISESNLFSSS